MASIIIPAEKIEVLDEVDVLVCGGGTAGVAAAVAAARNSARTLLVERWPFVGGMATAAFVNIWHTSDCEKIVIRGLVDEIIERMLSEGWMTRLGRYPRAHETHMFEPEGMRIILHRVLAEAGVRVMCYTPVGAPILEGNQIKGVILETKRGRRAVLAKIVIDATGDGDIAAKTGIPFEYGRQEDGLVQGMTLMYRLRNLDHEKLLTLSDEEVRDIQNEMKQLRRTGKLPPCIPNWIVRFMHDYINNLGVAARPLDEEDLTRATILATERALEFVRYYRGRVPGCEQVTIDKQGFSLGIRESRRVSGYKTLDIDMVLSAAKQEDAIGHGMWMIDIHDPKGSGDTTWAHIATREEMENIEFNDPPPPRKLRLAPGTSYHIPRGMCLNPHISNLAVVGRCASSTHEGHSSVRLQTHCMVMGQGIGTCAALAIQNNTTMAEYPVASLQRKLKEVGVYLEDIPSPRQAPAACAGLSTR